MSRKNLSPLPLLLPFILVVGVALLYSCANPDGGWAYDYTARLAGALLRGELGLAAVPHPALNELIPFEGRWYSAFPLGSVLSMLPVALLTAAGLVRDFPGAIVAAIVAAGCAWISWDLSAAYGASLPRRVVLVLFPLLGTAMWANVAFGGSWHIALGLAVLGQLGALRAVLLRRRAGEAGAWFALAFGNRTEVLLLAPVFLFLLWRQAPPWRVFVRRAAAFCLVPLLLGIATLSYNAARFGTPFDFGYARIPGVLEEPWYEHGIFSPRAIPLNVREMLLTTAKTIPDFPYLVPTGYGGSVFLWSPFLVFLFRPGARDRALKWLAWASMAVLTAALWSHGNPGGWQFSYRYAIELLPWALLVLRENSPARVGRAEWALFGLSLALSAYGAVVFLRFPQLILGPGHS